MTSTHISSARLSDRHGYTLIEMLVTVTIFSLAFTAIAAIFIGFTTAQSRASTSQRLLNEGNYILEAVTREVRMNGIDYACDGWNPVGDVTALCLRSPEGDVVRFQFIQRSGVNELEVCKTSDGTNCLIGGFGGSWVSLRPSFMTIESASFHVYPTVDPLLSSVAPADAWHPMTTIQLRISAGRGRAQTSFDLQTAASSRVYGL